MNEKMPRTPFSTSLSRSAQETQQRIQNIATGPKKRPPIPFLLLMFSACLLCGNLVSCHIQEAPEPSGPAASSQQDTAWVPALKDSAVPGLERREGVYMILLTAGSGDGAPADTLMLLRCDSQQQTAGLVSLPRDTLVLRDGELSRLGSGSSDPERYIADISHMLGIPIDYYIDVDTDGFAALVDELGGIDFDIPCDMDYDDPSQGLSIHFAAGPAHLNGQQAAEVARFRRNNSGASYSDLGRIQTQQQLIKALAQTLLSWESMTRINAFVDILAQNVDTDLSTADLLYFASQAVGVELPSGLETATLPGRTITANGYILGYAPDPEPTLELVNRLLNPYAQDMNLEDMNLLQVNE